MARRVDKVYLGFKGKYKKNIKFAGVPVRRDLHKISKQEARQKLGLDQNAIVIAAVGGSQGSQFINDNVSKAASRFQPSNLEQ